MWVMLLPTKDGAPSAIKHVQVEAKTKSGRKLHALRIDHPGGGGEFTANHFKEYCGRCGGVVHAEGKVFPGTF
jgi:ribosomal protein S27AE